MLGYPEIQRLIEFPEKLAVGTGAKTPHLFWRLRFKREQPRQRRKDEPPVKPMGRRGLVSERQSLLQERRWGFNVAGLSDRHEFPASRLRLFHMLEHMRRIHEVEGACGKWKGRRFAHNQLGGGRDDQRMAAALVPVSNIPFQQVGHARKGIV